MAEQEVIEKQLTRDEAMVILDMPKIDLTSDNILTFFQESWYCGEHDKICKTPDDWDVKQYQLKKIINAKNFLMQNCVSGQMKAKRYFEISSPLDRSCVACHGTGELYKFDLKTVKVNCHICAGKGKRRTKCPNCKGTGRHHRRFKDGGGINVECTRCDDKHMVVAKCINCEGKGKLKKVVRNHTLKSTTPCKHCEQLGFVTKKLPKPKRPLIVKKKKYTTPKIDNPVLDYSTAVTLSQRIKE